MSSPTYLEALRHLPDIIGELRGHIQPGRDGSDERRSPGFHSNAPARLTIITDSDHAYAVLVEHAHYVADTLGSRPPRTPTYRNPARCLGMPANTPPETAYAHTRTLCRYLEHQLPMLGDSDTVREIQDEIATIYRRLAAKYPARAAREHLQARCLGCRKLTLYKQPPRSFGDDEQVTCTTCHRWHTETETLEARAARERELKSKPGRKRAS